MRRTFYRSIATVSALVLSIVPVLSLADSTISVKALGQAFQQFGATPQQIHQRFGRPVFVAQDSLCCRLGTYDGVVLVQAYDVAGGGRVGFIYIKPWRVAGVVFDNLDSTRYLAISAFLSRHDPRRYRLTTCTDTDFYHAQEGEEYGGYPAIEGVFVRWAGSGGTMLMTRYRLNGHVVKKYDTVTGRDVDRPIANVDSLPLLQLGWFASTASVSDLHLSSNDDVSTTSQGTCY